MILILGNFFLITRYSKSTLKKNGSRKKNYGSSFIHRAMTLQWYMMTKNKVWIFLLFSSFLGKSTLKKNESGKKNDGLTLVRRDMAVVTVKKKKIFFLVFDTKKMILTTQNFILPFYFLINWSKTSNFYFLKFLFLKYIKFSIEVKVFLYMVLKNHIYLVFFSKNS